MCAKGEKVKSTMQSIVIQGTKMLKDEDNGCYWAYRNGKLTHIPMNQDSSPSFEDESEVYETSELTKQEIDSLCGEFTKIK